MTNSIKNYIEKNIETLDSNLIYFFIDAAYNLGEYEMIELITALESAGIETEVYRKAALEYNITYMFSDWINSGGERCPLSALLNAHINNRLGFNLDQIIQYIIINEDKFEEIEIEKFSGNPYVYVQKKGWRII